jgi:hypothetical protein
MGHGAVKVESKLELYNKYQFDLTNYLDKSLPVVFDRVGFLDYTVDVITYKERYEKLFNMVYYLESIVSNVLTPGIHMFGVPRVSWALPYVSSGFDIPTLSDISDQYQSNQIGLFGEYYCLFFGYGSLIIFYVTGRLFRYFYNKINYSTGYETNVLKVVIVYIFSRLINSFGLDWQLFEAITILVTFLIMRHVVLSPPYRLQKHTLTLGAIAKS